MKKVAFICGMAVLAGCAGKQEYIRPTGTATIEVTKTVNRPRSEVWDRAVPQLGKQFFVINNLDKSSGLINLSYSGDPEKYIDCGRVISFVQNARGERTYNFPGSKAQSEYEMMLDGTLIAVSRRMDLDGRVNVIFEEVDPQTTKVTANARYVVKRDVTIRDMRGNSRSTSASTSFNGNGNGTLPQARALEPAECRANGELEREILQNIN
ncbi:hypothetical protein J2789_004485 [Variovorax paradoxus]|uniref:hypothetical protein n=1 Tax=Variovorax atrisoli TaxID=3394203 RepID=UPI00119AFF5B|nr:hypothetical protein [Variovorax paradoxus]MDR6521795.1 hypothetical protein [Variovorax paradoxus]